MEEKEKLLSESSECVLEMDDERVVDVANQYIKGKYDITDGMLSGLAEGMRQASELYEEGEYFVPELILCSDAMYAGMDVFQKELPAIKNEKSGKIVIGVVEGDTHDIGKNLVKIMLETGGFEVHDLGRDVPTETFVDYVKNNEVDVLCMSSLMTTTMPQMGNVINRLKEEKIRDKVKIMVGGAPISEAFATKIGADAYTANAIKALEWVKQNI